MFSSIAMERDSIRIPIVEPQNKQLDNNTFIAKQIQDMVRFHEGKVHSSGDPRDPFCFLESSLMKYTSSDSFP